MDDITDLAVELLVAALQGGYEAAIDGRDEGAVARSEMIGEAAFQVFDGRVGNDFSTIGLEMCGSIKQAFALAYRVGVEHGMDAALILQDMKTEAKETEALREALRAEGEAICKRASIFEGVE